jgi:hypothetical protein
MTRAEQLIARLYTARKERWEEKQKMKGKSFLFDSGWADYRLKKKAVNAALRALLREGKELSEEVTHE